MSCIWLYGENCFVEEIFIYIVGKRDENLFVIYLFVFGFFFIIFAVGLWDGEKLFCISFMFFFYSEKNFGLIELRVFFFVIFILFGSFKIMFTFFLCIYKYLFVYAIYVQTFLYCSLVRIEKKGKESEKINCIFLNIHFNVVGGECIVCL